MRRKSEKEVRREYAVFLLIGCLALAVAFFLFIRGFLPPTSYEDLIVKDVVVTKFGYNKSSVRFAGYEYIRTSDGRSYHITGHYEREELRNLLSGEKEAVIRYDRGILPFQRFLEEMTVDGQTVVTFTPEPRSDRITLVILGTVLTLFGIGLICLFRWEIRRHRILNEKRNARIRKKYGKR